MPGSTPHDVPGLLGAYEFVTLLSFMGNITVFWAAWRYPELKRSTLNKLVLAMCTADVLWCFSALMSAWAIKDPNGKLCMVQGIFLQWFAFADTVWVFLIGAFVIQSFWRRGAVSGKRAFDKAMPLLVLVAFGATGVLAVSMLAVGDDVYTVVGVWCWISGEYQGARWFGFLAWETATPLFSLGVFLAVRCRIERRARAATARPTSVDTLSPLNQVELKQGDPRKRDSGTLRLMDSAVEAAGMEAGSAQSLPKRLSRPELRSEAPGTIDDSEAEELSAQRAGANRALMYMAVVSLAVLMKQVHRVADLASDSNDGWQLFLMAFFMPAKYGLLNSTIFSAERIVLQGSLAAFLNLPGGTEALMRFVVREHSEENLQFCLAVHGLRTGDERWVHLTSRIISRAASGPREPGDSDATASDDAAAGKVSAETIAQTFIGANAPLEVNLPDAVRKALESTLVAMPDVARIEAPSPRAATLLVDAEEEILFLIERDTFRRFTTTAQYARVLRDASAGQAVPRGRSVFADLCFLLAEVVSAQGRCCTLRHASRPRARARTAASMRRENHTTKLNDVEILYK